MKLHELGQAIRITLNGNAEVVIPTNHPKYKQITKLGDYALEGLSGPSEAPTCIFSPCKPTVVLANIEQGIGAAVVVDGQTIYHEDDDKGYSQSFTAEDVAKRTAKTLGVKLTRITLKLRDIGNDEWNFDDVEDMVNKKLAGIPVGLSREDRAKLTKLLKEKETIFNAAGGRGVELADKIDELRRQLGP